MVMNGRVLLLMSNGQRRVASEIGRRLELTEVRPSQRFASGLAGHLWEQVMLAMRVARRPLWSPSTSAPIAIGRQVVTIHDIAFVDVPQYFSPTFARLYRVLTALTVRRARHIVAVSDFTRHRLIDHYRLDPRRVTTIHSGVADAFHARPDHEIAAARAALGLPADVPYLMAFYGNDPRKNSDRLLAAWRLLRAQGQPAARLVLFGRASNPRVFAAADRVEQDPSVVLAGDVPDDRLAALFSGAQACVFPSLYAGFGLPVVEAARCGARIITSTVTSLPEVSPADALLLDPHDVQAIAAAMARMLAQGDQPAARDERIRAAARFDWDEAAARYAALFERIFER